MLYDLFSTPQRWLTALRHSASTKTQRIRYDSAEIGVLPLAAKNKQECVQTWTLN